MTKKRKVTVDGEEFDVELEKVDGAWAVSYTHPTLPTNRQVKISVVAVSLNKNSEKTH